MKVLHSPTNIGGMAYELAKAQRKLGLEATSYSMTNSIFKFKADIELDIANDPSAKTKAIKNLIFFPFEYDVFHFYYSETLSGGKLLDVPILKKLGKKIFFYFCGCDIRDSKKVIAKYEFSGCQNCWPMSCSPNQNRLLEYTSKYADGVFVSTPDLLEFAPKGAIWLPQPIDMEYFDDILDNNKINNNKIFTIAHAPTNRSIKGSDYIIKAVEELKDEGLDLDLLLIENMPYEEALKEYLKADLVVDQLMIGWYGQVSVEMMALKKPVVCYIRDDLMKLVDELPIVSATIDTIKDTIRELYTYQDRLESLSERGRQYVEEVHDSMKVAKIAMEAYNAK